VQRKVLQSVAPDPISARYKERPYEVTFETGGAGRFDNRRGAQMPQPMVRENTTQISDHVRVSMPISNKAPAIVIVKIC
jgi:hypothetical protein